MRLSELALAETALRVVADAVAERLREVRAAMQCELDDAGVRSVDATLPDGTRVATVTRSVARPRAAVTDPGALLAWVRTHAPGEAVSRVVTEVRPAYLAALLAEMTAAGAAEAPDPETGEMLPVPGVTVAAGRAATHSVRLTDGGRAEVAAAWRSGQLAALGLPQLAAAPDGGDQQ